MSSNPESDDLEDGVQQNLLDFLRIEVDLGFTLAKTAEIEASMQSSEHAEQARKHAESAIETIRRFQSKIKDTRALIEIRQRADELQRLIASLRIDRDKAR
jgi:Mg-chelatase subunit ChlI